MDNGVYSLLTITMGMPCTRLRVAYVVDTEAMSPRPTKRKRGHTMLYVITKRDAAGKLISARVSNSTADKNEESRWDWKTIDAAKEVAAALGEGYIATDAGPNVSPRYDVIKLPQIGDKVSKEFNGDSYPCGTIKSISPSLKLITTDEGTKFFRLRETGCWKNGGTWSLTPGHVEKQNPSF